MRIRRYHRFLMGVLALLLLIEPMVVEVVRAQNTPQRPISREVIENGIEKQEVEDYLGRVTADDIVLPKEMLQQLLASKGGLEGDCDQAVIEAHSVSDFAQMLAGIMGVLETPDLLSYYTLNWTPEESDVTGAVGDGKDVFEGLAGIPAMIKKWGQRLERFSHNIGRFYGRKGRNLGKALEDALRYTAKRSKQVKMLLDRIASAKVLKFLEAVESVDYESAGSTGKYLKKFWAAKFSSQARNRTDFIDANPNIKGIGKTVGVGLQVLGGVLAGINIAYSNERRMGGAHNWFSYEMTKNYVDIALAAVFVVMFFFAALSPIGWAVAAFEAAWEVFCLIGDAVGAYAKKWHAAYQDSFWFLKQKDKDFQKLIDNWKDPSVLHKDEMSLALLKAVALRSKLEVEKMEGEEKKAFESLIEKMEHQGVLTSYYYRQPWKMKDFNLETSMALWKYKATYMSWQPSQQEVAEEKDKGWFDKFTDAINPSTWIEKGIELGARVKTTVLEDSLEEKIRKNPNIRHVDFNPDFALLKKYQSYLAANKIQPGINIESLVGLRIEQAPFNYIPLVEVANDKITPEILVESFMVDTVFLGALELKSFAEALKKLAEDAEKFRKGMSEVSKLKKLYRERRDLRQTYKELLQAYLEDKEVDQALLRKLRYTPPRNTNSSRDQGASFPTSGTKAKDVLSALKDRINLDLLVVPKMNGDEMVDLMKMALDIKKMRDKSAMIESTLERMDCAPIIEQIHEPSLKKYITDGEFLNVNKGLLSGVWNWFAGLKAGKTEYDDNRNLARSYYSEFAEETEKAYNRFKAVWGKTIEEAITEVINEHYAFRDDVLRLVVDNQSKLEGDGIDLKVIYDLDSPDIYPSERFKLPCTLKALDPQTVTIPAAPAGAEP